MAIVSIIARPTNSVREIVPAASGCRAIASIAAATERPSAKAGPIDPIETASAAAIMLMSLTSTTPSLGLEVTDRGTDEDRGENRENVGLHQADEDFEGHQRDRDEQPGKRHDQRDDKLPTHHVAEQADHQREGAHDFGDDVERQHD